MIVLIHIGEGTIIHSWSFTTPEAVIAFQDAHRTGFLLDRETYAEVPRYLPDGTFDDPDTDTWIEVRGEDIFDVDGETPERIA